MGRKKKETRGGWNKKYTTENQRKKAVSQQRYAWSKEHRTAFTLRLNNDTQKDVIDFLKGIPNKQEFIVQMIRDYLKNQGQ